MMLIENFLMPNIEKTYSGKNYVMNLSESDSYKVTDIMLTEFYKNILKKYETLDSDVIDSTKGDIEKLETIEKCITSLEDMSKGTNVNIPELETVKKSYNIMVTKKNNFIKGYIQDKSIVKVFYNSIAVGIICGVNYILSSMVDYIKQPTGDINSSMSYVKNKKSEQYIVFKNLEKFNEADRKGELDKFFSITLTKENFAGLAIIGSTASILIISLICIVPLIRELIYFYYNTRMHVSEYLDLQSKYLDMNVNKLKYNRNTANKSVIKKQEKLSNNLRKLSDKFRVNFEVSDSKTKKEVGDEKVAEETIRTQLSSIEGSDGIF